MAQRKWTVDHHLPGGRYGAIAIQDPDGTPVLKMWRDDEAHLKLAHEIVDLLNREHPCRCAEPALKSHAGVGEYCTKCRKYRR